MHCTLFYPHLSYFLHFILYGKGNSASLSNLRNKHLAAMLLENFWIQINSKLVFWPKITANLLLLSLVKRLLLLPGAAIIPRVSLILQKSVEALEAQGKCFNVCIIFSKIILKSVGCMDIKKRLHEKIAQRSMGFKRLNGIINTKAADGTVPNTAMKTVCTFPSYNSLLGG